MASHHSASQWRTWIAQCEQSDLTVARFCQSIGVSVNTYYRWRQSLFVGETDGDNRAGETMGTTAQLLLKSQRHCMSSAKKMIRKESD